MGVGCFDGHLRAATRVGAACLDTLASLDQHGDRVGLAPAAPTTAALIVLRACLRARPRLTHKARVALGGGRQYRAQAALGQRL